MCKFINNQPKCICPNEFSGENCEHYRCSGFCLNKGMCEVAVSSERSSSNDMPETAQPPLTCRCQPQWTGDRCEIAASVCKVYIHIRPYLKPINLPTSTTFRAQELCHNGATCYVDDNRKESCICPKGFTGPNCQNCDDLKCENSGVCKQNATGGPSHCDCPMGYRGRRCEAGN